MKVRPLGDKILVKRDEAATKTESGIFLPESAKDKPKQGTVIVQGTSTTANLVGLGAAAGGDGLHVVVEAAGGEAYSLIVDRVADVVVIPDDGIEIPSGAAGGLAEDCIAGVHAAATGLVYVLSLDAIVAGLAESTTERTQA